MAETGDQLLEEKQVSTRELLNRSAQDLIEEVNAKRKRDTTLLAGTTERLVWYAATAHAQCVSLQISRELWNGSAVIPATVLKQQCITFTR